MGAPLPTLCVVTIFVNKRMRPLVGDGLIRNYLSNLFLTKHETESARFPVLLNLGLAQTLSFPFSVAESFELRALREQVLVYFSHGSIGLLLAGCDLQLFQLLHLFFFR